MRSIALYRGFHLNRTPVRGSSSAPTGAQTSILRRIFAGIERWEQRRIEREAERFIAEHGGRLTDSIERELLERVCGGRGFAP